MNFSSLRYCPLILAIAAMSGCSGDDGNGSDLSKDGVGTPENSAETGKAFPSDTSDPTTMIRNKIKWNTASEDRAFGYFLARADSEDGPFLRVNPRPVPAKGSTDDVQTYEIVDEQAVPGATYFYKIEVLGYNNRTRDFSPVFPYVTPAS